MAAQNPHPGTWFERDSDGCSGLLGYARDVCFVHDCDYWWGGKKASCKLRSDKALRRNTAAAGFFGKLIAYPRYAGVRMFTYNSPPQSHLGTVEKRPTTMKEAVLAGGWKIDAWNWEGPGRGIHACSIPVPNNLLPEQMGIAA